MDIRPVSIIFIVFGLISHHRSEKMIANINAYKFGGLTKKAQRKTLRLFERTGSLLTDETLYDAQLPSYELADFIYMTRQEASRLIFLFIGLKLQFQCYFIGTHSICMFKIDRIQEANLLAVYYSVLCILRVPSFDRHPRSAMKHLIRNI